jgi:hypothetical protein
MKTKSLIANGRSRHFTRCAFLLAMIIAAPMVVSIQSVFAQSWADDENAADPCGLPGDSELGANQTLDLPQVAGPALAPAPMEPVNPQPAPMPGGFVPEPPRDFSQRSADPSIPATSPMLTAPPDTMARPGGGLYSPLR